MKTKVKLFKCYYCKNGSPKDEMIRIDTGKTTKKGVGIIKFYHKECLQISNQNKASNERRSSAYSKESDTHENLKNVIYKKLINGDLNLVDQFGMYIQFNKESFVAIESPVIVELQNRLPFYDKESCKLCFKEYNLENSEITSLLDRTGHSNYIDGDNHYSLHPCIKCPFNKNTYKHIFDIGIGYNGKYTDVIEILHTSKCKSNKIKYCIQNKINLYEIKSDVDLDTHEIKCNRIWWESTEGKIEILDEYK